MTDKKAEEAVIDNYCGEASSGRLSPSVLSNLDVQRRAGWRSFFARALTTLSPYPSTLSIFLPKTNQISSQFLVDSSVSILCFIYSGKPKKKKKLQTFCSESCKGVNFFPFFCFKLRQSNRVWMSLERRWKRGNRFGSLRNHCNTYNLRARLGPNPFMVCMPLAAKPEKIPQSIIVWISIPCYTIPL